MAGSTELIAGLAAVRQDLGVSQLTSSYLMSQNMQPAQRALLLILLMAFRPQGILGNRREMVLGD
jgi:ABC-type branched-subunit amino acid transport system permease subunit